MRRYHKIRVSSPNGSDNALLHVSSSSGKIAVRIISAQGFGNGTTRRSLAKSADYFNLNTSHMTIEIGPVESEIRISRGDLVHKLCAAAAIHARAVGSHHGIRNAGQPANHRAIFVKRTQTIEIQRAHGISIGFSRGIIILGFNDFSASSKNFQLLLMHPGC